MDMKLEVIVIPVSNVDRSKAFYEKLGFRLDIDYAPDDQFRVVQFTPPGSEASVIFGKGVVSANSGLTESLVLTVTDIDVAREDLIRRGASVSEVFHYAGGPSQWFWKKPACCRPRSARSFLFLVCLV